tara:strand:+ start:496 stop:1065 length:570 start_codon:yes stop_codon:yes gene_type:complete
MSFWTDSGGKDPKRNFRFKVTIAGFEGNKSVVWWAKKVQKPNYSVAEVKHVYLGHTYYYPGKLEWQEITMTLVDPAEKQEGGVDALFLLHKIIEDSGYELPNPSTKSTTMSKDKSVGALGTVQIAQLDADGNAIETWELRNPFLKKVSFSDLDYENDDLTTIDISLRYDWATCVTGNKTESAPFFNANT